MREKSQTHCLFKNSVKILFLFITSITAQLTNECTNPLIVEILIDESCLGNHEDLH